jgi:hypothetical protein
MNQKRFIILFTLLIFFIIHVDGNLDCYPAGKRKKGCDKEWGTLITIFDLLLLLNNSTNEN